MVTLVSAGNAAAGDAPAAAVPSAATVPSPATTTTATPTPVNAVIQDLADRLRKKDPTLSTVSLRRLPLADISPSEVLYILQALLETSGKTKSNNNNQNKNNITMSTSSPGATMESDDDKDNDMSAAAAPAAFDDNDEDEESLACPISTLHLWLPDHPSNNNNNNSNHNNSSRMLMSDHSSSFNSSFTDSHDGDFVLVLDDGLAQQEGNLVLQGSTNNNMNAMMNNHDSLQSMDWERGNASNITGMMSSVEEEEHDDDYGDDDVDEQQDDGAAAVIEPDDDDDDVETASTVMDPLERALLQQEEVQPLAPPPLARVPQQPPQQQSVVTPRVPAPDYSIVTPALANNTSITSLAVSSAASSAAWKTLFCGVGQNTSIQTLELGDPCLIADPCTLETDACKVLAEEVLMAKRRTRRAGSRNNIISNNNVDSFKTSSSSLQRLVLRSFSLPFQGVEYLARGFENKSSLESVELQQIETDPGSFGRILESLASPSSNVKSVILVDCDLGIDMLLDDHPLTLLLSTSRSLETLRMTECQVTSVEVQAMAAATPPPSAGLRAPSSLASSRPPLKVLDLRGNELGNDAAPALAAFLDKQTSLEKLILEDNQLGDEAIIEHFAAALARHKSLRKLNLRGNGLSSKSVSRSLILPASLEVFDISENRLGGGGGAAASSSRHKNAASNWIGFFQANSHRTSSWSLVLEATSLTDIDLVPLCQGLEESPTYCSLQSLNVSQNDFGTRGMQAIVNLLSSSLVHSTSTTTTNSLMTIQSLNLSACHLADESIAILAPCLTRCGTSLRRVYLGFNQIGNTGCQYLGVALAGKTCCIQELQLQFNPFGPTGLNHLVQGVKPNARLHHLSVLKDGGVECDRTRKLMQELQHWLALNRAGRQALSCSCTLPTAIWPTVLARAGKVYGPTACYFLLQEESRVAA